MKVETPKEYIKNFEAQVEEYTNEYFGTRQEFVIREINRLEYELMTLKINENGEVHLSQELNNEAKEIGIEKCYNLRKRKIDFLKEQSGEAPKLESFEGQLKFDNKIDLVELAQALYSNGNWKGHRTDLVKILAYLSIEKEINSKKLAEKVRNRVKGPVLLPKLVLALEQEARK